MKIARPYKINVVIPFVSMGDIAFLLLIFLIVTSSVQKLPDIKFQLPESTQFDKISNNENIEILVDENNRIYIEEFPCDLAYLRKNLINTKQCVISADKKASFKIVDSIINILKEKEYEKISFTVKRKVSTF